MAAAPHHDYKFEGWVGHDTSAAEGKMVWGEYEPKPWRETDVDIRITHCGVCGTDSHTLRSGWGPTPYPVVVGHEIVGVAVRVGSEVAPTIRPGDRVGVGAQSDSCRGRDGEECAECASGEENYCSGMVVTYADTFRYDGTGAKTAGGFARYSRVPGHFVIPIPAGVDSAAAAPMLCGGVTVYSPLVRFGGGGSGNLEGVSVGVVGLGGLGHMAVQFSKALGAKRVVGLSRRGDKRSDALRLGCDEYVATGEGSGWAVPHAGTLDLIVSTISSLAAVSMGEYLSLLRRDGTFCQVGNPDDGDLVMPQGAIIAKRLRITGSCIGSPGEIREMLQLAADKNIRPWIEERPMSEANQAIVDLDAGKARYRYVLVNDWK
jgi:D-arabinose 1-dehydrogenase-like Zn-dependent alcohol dehydrogenase